MAYAPVSVQCLYLTHSHTHFLWLMWLLVFYVSPSLIYILTSYGVCGSECSVSLPHSFTYSLLMANVTVSVLCLFLTHSHTHFLWHMWLFVFCVSSSPIHILTSYGICGCLCSVSLPHSFTYSLLKAYMAVSVLCLFLYHSHTHFLWRIWLLVLCVFFSLTHKLTSYDVFGCECPVSLPHSLTYSLLMAYVVVSVLCLFLTHSHTHLLWRIHCKCSVSLPHSFTYSPIMAYVAVSVLYLFLTHSNTHFFSVCDC